MKYLVESRHEVFEDNFEDGEGKLITEYNRSSMIEAESAVDAIETYFKSTLGYTFEISTVSFEDEELINCVLVDKNLVEVFNDEPDYKRWMDGEINLYNNHIYLKCSVVQAINLEGVLNGMAKVQTNGQKSMFYLLNTMGNND